MRVKRIVFLDRAPFKNLDLDLTDSNIISLTGINGAGKTTILSYIVDAFYEMTRKAYSQEFSGDKAGKLYRVSSPLYNMSGANSSIVYIAFDVNGEEEYYLDLIGDLSEELFNKWMSSIWKDQAVKNWPINYASIKRQMGNDDKIAKFISIDERSVQSTFSTNLLTYFPSYRYEQPGYLNDVFGMKLEYKYMPDYVGYLINPIEVTSDLQQIANWMMDIVLDNHLYHESYSLEKLQYIVNSILSFKYKKNVRIGIGPRNTGGARIQIVDIGMKTQIYPTIFSISAGESALLCLFGELIRQADRLHIHVEDIEGIILIDEVDKHLHIFLQKEVFPQLVKMFPKVQFIVSTHSAFINIGLEDTIADRFRIIDLDNNGLDCSVVKNDVFREAYETMIVENERYVDFYNKLSEKMKNMVRPIVYLEGRTDEKYFKKAIEVFDYLDLNVDFQWIGHINNKGNEEFTGESCLTQGIEFIKGRNPEILHFFLYDCDTKHQESDENNIVVMTMPYISKHTIMNKGIENALELEGIDLEPFYCEHSRDKDYGSIITIKEFEKMKMCNYICGLDVDSQKSILRNLKPVIDKIVSRIAK